ncbi:MAG: CBS domain-containing protein [Myxococcaceae bacterium]|nr:CBS domain-containing protein [Myxococcaceae bacterium]
MTALPSTSLRSLISCAPVFVDLSASIASARALVALHQTQYLCVTREGSFVGMVSSERLDSADSGAEVGDFALFGVPVVSITASVKEAMKTLSLYRQHALPVRDGEKVIGLITVSDCIFGLSHD